MRRCLETLGLVEIESQFYDSEAATDIPFGERMTKSITVWPGYITTLNQHEERHLVRLEVIHRVVQKESCFDIMKKYRDAEGSSGSDFDSFRYKIRDELVGKVVVTLYDKKSYLVEGISFNQSPKTMIWKKMDGSPISVCNRGGDAKPPEARHGLSLHKMSVCDYYRAAYPQLLDTDFNLTQPLLAVVPCKQTYNRCWDCCGSEHFLLVPQVCYLATYDHNDHFLNSAFKKHLCFTPTRLVRQISDFSNRFRESAEVNTQFHP